MSNPAQRPLSPHLSVYRMMYTMVLSGLHRMSGLYLSACAFLFAGWMLRPETTRNALAMDSPCTHDVWLWLNRLAIPLMLVMLLLGVRLFL